MIKGNIASFPNCTFGQCRFRRDPSTDIINSWESILRKVHEEGFLVGRRTTSRNNPIREDTGQWICFCAFFPFLRKIIIIIILIIKIKNITSVNQSLNYFIFLLFISNEQVK